MLNLHINHPWLFEQFCNGFYSIRRTHHFWAGLWSDLVIDQFVMMRTIKKRRGFTRGRRMAESTSNLWVATMHNCCEVHHAMELVTRLQHQSSKHVEMSTTRRGRDNSYVKLLFEL